MSASAGHAENEICTVTYYYITVDEEYMQCVRN